MAGLNVSQIQGLGKDFGLNLSNEQADKILGQAFDKSQFGADANKVRSIFSSMGGGGQQSQAPQSNQGFSSPSSTNFQDIVRQSLEMQRQASAPAIASLQASLPEISQRFQSQTQQTQAEIEPLKQRYSNLLNSVLGKAKQSEEAQTRITSGELGKRGIVGSSTLAEQEIQSAVEPIRSGARGAEAEIGLASEQGVQSLQNIISGFATQETEQRRAVKNAIAQLDAGGGQQAVQNALAILQSNQAQAGAQASLELQQKQQELAQKVYDQVTLPTSQANIANVKSTIAERGATAAAGDPFAYLQGGFSTGAVQSTGFSNVDSLLAQGKFAEARQLLLNP